MAISTGVAPSYATNTMGAFESDFVYTYHLQSLVYLHIDDIFIIWQHGLVTSLTFIKHLNNCSANLNFTFEVSKDKVSFFDTWDKLENNKLSTDLLSKPIDS